MSANVRNGSKTSIQRHEISALLEAPYEEFALLVSFDPRDSPVRTFDRHGLRRSARASHSCRSDRYHAHREALLLPKNGCTVDIGRTSYRHCCRARLIGIRFADRGLARL